MTKRLGESDRRAVDLLLDRSSGAAAGNGNAGYVTHAQPASEPATQGVQKVLQLLDLMVADEPAPDLVSRTLGRIDGSRVTAPVHPAAAVALGERPHA